MGYAMFDEATGGWTEMSGPPEPVPQTGDSAFAPSADILDLLKYGVGVWGQTQERKSYWENKTRFETDGAGGLVQQGQPGFIARDANGRFSMSASTLLVAAVVALLVWKAVQ